MALSKKCVKIKQDKTMESTDEEEFQEKKNDKRTEKETGPALYPSGPDYISDPDSHPPCAYYT